MQKEKKCKACQKNKDLNLFYKQIKGMFGRTSECKECRKKRSKVYADDHKDQKYLQSKFRHLTIEKKEYMKQWRKNNPNYMKEYRKKIKEMQI